MTPDYKIAIVGSGPAGLSAAARAAQSGVSHILLESGPHISGTIFKYQKGKHVMAEPGVLPLRSPLKFAAASREKILAEWNQGITDVAVNLKLNAEVVSIQGQRGDFRLTLKNGELIVAEYVVLGIGLQGNLRKLGAPGEDNPIVQYQLDDPDEYSDETLVVVGAGDAAVENAVALARQNTVVMVNRSDDFSRLKEGNLSLIQDCIKKGLIECYTSTTVARLNALEQINEGDPGGLLVLTTPNGEAEIRCHRIIARLGATPPRKFVESCGVQFPNASPGSVPVLSPRYESNVTGLYIVGALGGYPLIKQAMNQGYEVIEFIQGHAVEPADEPLLNAKLSVLPQPPPVTQFLEQVRNGVPLLSGLTPLQLREIMLDSRLHNPAAGAVVFTRNDYTDSLYVIVAGEVHVEIAPDRSLRLPQGEFFGEMGLISGRRRSATVRAGEACLLLEIPRRSMKKLIGSVESVKQIIDQAFMLHAIQSQLATGLSGAALAEVVASARIENFAAGQSLFHEGEIGDSLHLIRRGSVTVARKIGGRDIVLAYVAAGNYVGEMALLSDTPRSATVTATVATETLRLEGAVFKQLLEREPGLRRKLEAKFQERMVQNIGMETHAESGGIISFLVQQGLGEGTDVLLIDESLCVGCNNCEQACADTHDGNSRLNREAGPTYALVHVPTSCRHCEHPYCMKDCPPDAIHRSPNGEVYITDACIGCGNCEKNCPYGVIQMATTKQAPKKSLLAALLFGADDDPGHAHSDSPKKAVKCDMCRGLDGGPACVRACPTGAALRVSPEQFMSYANLQRHS